MSDASLKLRAGFGPTSLIAIVVAIFFATSVGFLVAQRQLGAVVPTALAGLALLVIVFGGRYPIGASALIDADSARITKWPWRPAVVNAGDVVGVHVIDRGAFAALMMTGALSAEGTSIQVVRRPRVVDPFSSGSSILVEARAGRGSLLLPGGASPVERAEHIAKVLGVSDDAEPPAVPTPPPPPVPTNLPPAGWFADPQNATQLRYWNGTAWTEHTSPKPPAG